MALVLQGFPEKDLVEVIQQIGISGISFTRGAGMQHTQHILLLNGRGSGHNWNRALLENALEETTIKCSR